MAVHRPGGLPAWQTHEMMLIPANELAQQQFEGMDLGEPFARLLGPIAPDAFVLVWGPPGSGKSTFTLALASELADHGPTLYVSAEEGIGSVMAERIRRLSADHPNLIIAEFHDLDDVRRVAERLGARFVILDSISELDPRSQSVENFRKWAKEKGIGLYLIAHATKGGQYRGPSYVGHGTDVIVHVNDGEAATRKNRFSPLASVPVPFKRTRRNPRKPGSMRKRCSTSPQPPDCRAMFAHLEGEEDKPKKKEKPKPRAKAKTKAEKPKKAKKTTTKPEEQKKQTPSPAAVPPPPPPSGGDDLDAAMERIEKMLMQAGPRAIPKGQGFFDEKKWNRVSKKKESPEQIVNPCDRKRRNPETEPVAELAYIGQAIDLEADGMRVEGPAMMFTDGKRLWIVPEYRVRKLRRPVPGEKAADLFAEWHQYPPDGVDFEIMLPDGPGKRVGYARTIRYASDKILAPEDRKGTQNNYIHEFDRNKRPVTVNDDVVTVEGIKLDARGILN